MGTSPHVATYRVGQRGTGRHAVYEKTIHRDLAWLRDIGAPIFFDMERSTYYWDAKLPLPWWFGGEREGPLPRF